MAVYPATAAGRARADVHRLRLSRHQVYACRSCRGAVRVTSAHYLPEDCPECGAFNLGGRPALPQPGGLRRRAPPGDPGPRPLPRMWEQRLDAGERRPGGAARELS